MQQKQPKQHDQIPQQEISEILAALVGSLAHKHKEIDERFTSIDVKHSQNYSRVIDFVEAFDKKMKISIRDGIDGLNGQDGYTPVKNRDYFDGEKGENGEKGEKGENGSPDEPEDIRDKLQSLEEENRLPIMAIKGLKKELDTIMRLLRDTSTSRPESYYGGVNQFRLLLNGVLTGDNGVKNINFVGVSITNDNKGNATITVTGGTGGGFNNINEIVSGSSTTFTLANTPIDSTKVCLYGGGSRLTPGIGQDYTISGKNITTSFAYSAGQVLADYSS